MQIDAHLVRRIARLARLDLSEGEIAAYRRQLEEILEYFEQLKAADVEGVEPLTHAGGAGGVFRADAPGPCLSQERALGNAPAQQGGFFVVPRVIEE